MMQVHIVGYNYCKYVAEWQIYLALVVTKLLEF
jgi:hypothetical protein